MKAIKGHILVPLFTVILGITLSNGAAAYLADTSASEPTLQLGKIEVDGQQQIVQALQAIKIALKRPESSDPTQRDAVVCRIEKDIGTHNQDMLVCATNATLGNRRESIQNGMLAGCESIGGLNCSAAKAFSDRSPLGAAIKASSDHIMRMPVNGAALRNLLSKIPDPTPADGTVPAAGSAAAPAAATSPDQG